MKVGIKDLSIRMDVKNSGIELEVYDNDGTFRGDFYLTKTGLVWCHGKKARQNGVKVSWNDFISWMES